MKILNFVSNFVSLKNFDETYHMVMLVEADAGSWQCGAGGRGFPLVIINANRIFVQAHYNLLYYDEYYITICYIL